MENKTAVEWLIEQYEEKAGTLLLLTFKELMKPEINKALEMEKQQMIDLVQSIKDYTLESRNILGHDEREAYEFVDIFLETFKK